MAKIYFKALFDVMTIRGWHLQRSTRTCVYSFNNEPLYARITHVHVCICITRSRPFTIRRDFNSSIYWDELAEICGDVLRAAEFREDTVHIHYTYS